MNHKITSDITKIPPQWFFDNILTLESNKHLSKLDFWEMITQSHCWVYLLDDSPIGFSRWVSDGHIFSSLCDLYVVPERRRQGFGEKLLQHNLHQRLIAPTTKILQCFNNDEAYSLYLKLGFKDCDAGEVMLKYAKS